MGVIKYILMEGSAVSDRAENGALRSLELGTSEHLNESRASESNFSELGHL